MQMSSRNPMMPVPKRERRPSSSKIVFFSCEGSVTEEEYFKILSDKIFVDISNKIYLISARKDFFQIPRGERTQEQWNEQNKSSPKYVLERLENFKKEKHHIYEFEKHPEDEFWLVLDVDDHTEPSRINEFKTVLKQCNDKGIQYAVTNPFFEFWLYLHHFDVSEDDWGHANRVGDDHFRRKMSDAGIILGGNDHKVPKADDYTKENIALAAARAKGLHTNLLERWPMELGSHVYRLVEKFFELLSENSFLDMGEFEEMHQMEAKLNLKSE